MKTTVDIPDVLLREAKATAAREGTSLRAVIIRSLREELNRNELKEEPPQWQRSFGSLSRLESETAEINNRVEDAFGQIDENQWQ